MATLTRVLVGAVVLIVPLIAAAFLTPPDFPLLARQVLLAAWGVGGTLIAERLLFGTGWRRATEDVGFVAARPPALAVALLAALPMWLFLPAYALVTGLPLTVTPEWLAVLIGVVLVNGLAEEVIHRGFIFGHLRREMGFLAAATISAAIFAAQHLYLMATIGVVPGFASVVLAAALGYPLAFMFEAGGRSLGAPAILHTGSNAPIVLFVLPAEATASILMPHMAVVLVSIYLCMLFRRRIAFDHPAAP